jgi:hypothetical protein
VGADFEVDARWSGKVVRRRRGARVSTDTFGDIERTEEATEGEPGGRKGKAWRFRTWVTGSKS